MAKNIEINVKTANGYELLYPAVNPDILKIDSSNVQIDNVLSEKLGLSNGANMSDMLGKLENGVFYNKSPYQVDNLNTTPLISRSPNYNHSVVSDGNNFLWIYFNKNTSYDYGKNELCFGSTLFGESENLSYTFNSYSSYTSFRFSPNSLVYHKDVGWIASGLKIYGNGYYEFIGCILQSSDGKNYKEIEQAKTDNVLRNSEIIQILYANEKFYIGSVGSDDDGDYGGTNIYSKNFSQLNFFQNYGAVEIAVNRYTNETLLFTTTYNNNNIFSLAYSTDGVTFYNTSSSNSQYNSGCMAIGLQEGGFLIKSGNVFYKAKFTSLDNNRYLHTDTILYIYNNGSYYGNLEEINGVITSVDGMVGKNVYTEDYGVSWKESTIPTFPMPSNYGGLYSFIVNNQVYIIPYGVTPYLTSSNGIEYTKTHTKYKNFLLNALTDKLSIPAEQIVSNDNNISKFEYGSYIGNGDNYINIVCPFEPKTVIVQYTQESNLSEFATMIAIKNKSGMILTGAQIYNTALIKAIWNNNKISFTIGDYYTTINAKGRIYNYIILG